MTGRAGPAGHLVRGGQCTAADRGADAGAGQTAPLLAGAYRAAGRAGGSGRLRLCRTTG